MVYECTPQELDLSGGGVISVVGQVEEESPTGGFEFPLALLFPKFNALREVSLGIINSSLEERSQGQVLITSVEEVGVELLQFVVDGGLA